MRVTPDETRVHLTISNELLQKLEKLKSIKKLSTHESIEYAVDMALTQYESSLEKIKKSKKTTGRTVPAAIKKQVIKRSHGVCEFPGCDEDRYLELEHVHPYAKGGRHEIANLKLYCKAHNQRAAIVQFGQQHMDQFINKRS